MSTFAENFHKNRENGYSAREKAQNTRNIYRLYEGKTHNLGLQQATTHNNSDLCASLCELGLNITHADAHLEAWRHSA